MENIQFDGFTLRLKDFAKEEENGEVLFYLSDCEIDANEFDAFGEFLWNHSRPGEYFTTTFNGESFHGRFGQFIFSRHGHIYDLRLVFVRSISDEKESKSKLNFVMNNHSYTNLFKQVVNQGIVIERLLSTLKDKNILSKSDITDMVVVLEKDRWKPQTELNSEVEDLEKYLKEKNDTIAEYNS